MLTGTETNPKSSLFGISRNAIQINILVVSEVMVTIHTGIPNASSEFEQNKAFENPSNFEWIGTDTFVSGVYKYRRHTILSLPYLKNKEWHIKTMYESEAKPVEISLWDLGIIPDYVRRPNADILGPAGWNPCCSTKFNINDTLNRIGNK